MAPARAGLETRRKKTEESPGVGEGQRFRWRVEAVIVLGAGAGVDRRRAKPEKGSGEAGLKDAAVKGLPGGPGCRVRRWHQERTPVFPHPAPSCNRRAVEERDPRGSVSP